MQGIKHPGISTCDTSTLRALAMTLKQGRFILQVTQKWLVETELMQAVENYLLILETIIYFGKTNGCHQCKINWKSANKS